MTWKNWIEPTEEQLDAQIQQAVEAGLADNSARATKASIVDLNLHLLLNTGVMFTIPLMFIEGLMGASEKQLNTLSLESGGRYLYWDDLDVHMEVENLKEGVFGTEGWMEYIKELIKDECLED